MNIVGEIKGRAYGSRIAVQDGDRAISYDALFLNVGLISDQLKSHPAFSEPRIPRIGVRLPNGLSYIVVALSVIDLGACFVPIPDELTDDEVVKLVRETALHGLISSSVEGEQIALPENLGTVRIESCPVVPVGFPELEFEAISPAFIRFSSGTTANSKGVVLSHKSLLERIVAANSGLGVTTEDRVLWTLPMAHHFAVSIVLYLYFGATTVLESLHQPERVYEAAKRSKATLLYGSPFHFAQLAQYAPAERLPSLRLVVSTASALNEAVAEAFLARFDVPITQALGIIEVGLPLLNKKHARESPTSLGVAQEFYEWKIEGEQPVGELMLSGPGMFDAYLLPWQPRDQVTVNGWFATGDLVEEMDNGTLLMRGRSKSVINVGGMKVFPEEVEAVLNGHPSIARCRVFGCAHALWEYYPNGEMVLAKGAQCPTMREIRLFCESRMAAYKIPLMMRQVGEIALTASGKVKRH